MNTKIKFCPLLPLSCCAALLMLATPLSAQSSANFALTNAVFTQAGGNSQSQSFHLRSGLGQSSPIGNSNVSSFRLSGGFYGWRLPIAQLAFQFVSGWSWISFNLTPPDLALEQIFGDLKHLKIMVNGSGQFYIPRTINSIGNLSVEQGYKVYFDAAEPLALTGKWVAVTTPISLAAGWNFISYLATGEMDTEIAFAVIVADLVIAKDDAGHFYVPETVNAMEKMRPTKGYKIYMKNPATLIYPLIAAPERPAR